MQVEASTLDGQNVQAGASTSTSTNQNERVNKNQTKTTTDKSAVDLMKPKLTPSQENSKNKIVEMQKRVDALTVLENSEFCSDEWRSNLKKLGQELAEEKKKLSRLEQNQVSQQKCRQNKKLKIEKICETNPDVGELLRPRKSYGKPPIENKQPHLLSTIVDLVSIDSGTGADHRRRTDMLRTCQTLDQLHLQLKTMGFTISRSALYLRLIPHRANTAEGKRHVRTVPVKLARAQTSEHKKHEDTQFCTATIRNLNSLASFLGPAQVFYLSQDDKCRVPLGITAAKKQSSILMHMQYRVTLPDHDWVVAEKHKLIPSVYAGIIIKPDGFGDASHITCSGPTVVRIRSGKHDTSNAVSHALDLRYVLNSDPFASLCRTETSLVKPIVIICSDGGPDENPRFDNVIKHAIANFKTYNLDGLFLATNAPGRSAFNPVERRMATLSFQLSGVVLRHDKFGSHLDSNGQCTDAEKEKQNFQFAGESLAEIWNGITIDGHPVEATYVNPDAPRDFDSPEIDHSWAAKHVRTSQYCLQIIKCEDRLCCKEFRSNIKQVLKSGFLPPPLKVSQSFKSGIFPTPVEKPGKFLSLFVQLSIDIHPNAPGFINVPYDFYCKTMKLKLHERTCTNCGYTMHPKNY